MTVHHGATILGGETVIGRGTVVGGNATVSESVPPASRLVAEAPRPRVRRARGRRRGGGWLAGLLAAGLAAGLAGPGLAAEPSAQGSEADYAYELADELMSPFCPGRSLSECPSPQAAELRAWIVEQDRNGVPRSEVEEELFRVWGDELRQAPKPEGVGLAAYVIPALLFVVGGGVLAIFWSRQRGGRSAEAGAEAAPLAPVDPELERALDEEMRRAESADDPAA